jgi:hypothetical protein
LLTKMTIVGRNGPLSAMSRAGFRNVGVFRPEDPHIYLLSQLVLADVEGTRAAWFWFGPKADADVSMDVRFHFTLPGSLASYEMSDGDAAAQSSQSDV